MYHSSVTLRPSLNHHKPKKKSVYKRKPAVWWWTELCLSQSTKHNWPTIPTHFRCQQPVLYWGHWTACHQDTTHTHTHTAKSPKLMANQGNEEVGTAGQREMSGRAELHGWGLAGEQNNYFSTICSPKCQQTHLVPQRSFTKHASSEARTGLYPWQSGQSRSVNATRGGRDSSLEGWFNGHVEMAAFTYSFSAQLATASFAPLPISSGEKGEDQICWKQLGVKLILNHVQVGHPNLFFRYHHTLSSAREGGKLDSWPLKEKFSFKQNNKAISSRNYLFLI